MERLRTAGHVVRLVRSVGEAELARRSGRVDAVLAAAEVAELRSRFGDTVVAAWLPARSTERAAELLELGVDEVLDGTMGARELLARVAALVRRAPAPAAVAGFGPLLVDPNRGEATWRGQRLQLTPRERGVLRVLAEAQGATVRREALYRTVWGYSMVRGDRTVDVNVKRLRAKLSAVTGELQVATEAGVGYRLELRPAAAVVTDL